MIPTLFAALNKVIKWMTLDRLLLIIIGLLIIFGGVQRCTIQNMKSAVKTAENDMKASLAIADAADRRTVEIQNKYGESIAKNVVYEISTTNLRSLLEKSRALQFVKHIPDAGKKNIEMIQTFDASFLDESVKIVPIEIPCPDDDSTARRVLMKAYQWQIKDEYNDISAIVLDTPRVHINVPIKSVILWQRKKWLGLRIGHKEWFQEAYSPNRLIKIDSQLVVRVQKK